MSITATTLPKDADMEEARAERLGAKAQKKQSR